MSEETCPRPPHTQAHTHTRTHMDVSGTLSHWDPTSTQLGARVSNSPCCLVVCRDKAPCKPLPCPLLWESRGPAPLPLTCPSVCHQAPPPSSIFFCCLHCMLLLVGREGPAAPPSLGPTHAQPSTHMVCSSLGMQACRGKRQGISGSKEAAESRSLLSLGFISPGAHDLADHVTIDQT